MTTTPNGHAGLLTSFIDHFTRAIRQEMDAMRERMGSFEAELADGRRVEPASGQVETLACYHLVAADRRLVPGLECSLRSPGGEYLVRVEEATGALVTLSCQRGLEHPPEQATLVFYPWYLYERLLAVLTEINEQEFYVDRGLTLFGKIQPAKVPGPALRDHRALNDSQRAAVQLCVDADLAFVWGPPGTGKTTTLAHIVDELAAHGRRLLVLATTNAAVDQALATIVREPGMAEPIERGRVVRLGRSDAPTFGTGLHEVVDRLHAAHRGRLDRLLARRPVLDAAHAACRKALEALSATREPCQLALFGGHADQDQPVELTGIFTPPRHRGLARLAPADLARVVRQRLRRLERVDSLAAARVSECRTFLQGKERAVIEDAGVVLATLTNAYFSPLLNGQRFDVVIVEEASMAVLPALFYAACLGRAKTVMVGDPCQLPSIVQSDADYVRQVMGRNIFEVTVPEPLRSPFVALLDVQYRMHPVIGALVSDTFYQGKLGHSPEMEECETIAGYAPFAGAPLVVLDLAGQSRCSKSAKGASRLNETNARISAELARQAIRSGAQSVAIITPYVAQVQAIRSILKGEAAAGGRIECSTVHRFQGRERDVIILDTVDAEPMAPGVLLNERGESSSAARLINVAISRARGKLVLVADVEYFQRRAPGGVMNRVITRACRTGRRESAKPGRPGPQPAAWR